MSTSAILRRSFQSTNRFSSARLQIRSISCSRTLRKDTPAGVHHDSKEHNTPRDGPAYTAEGRRHKTDNEHQREQAVRGTPEEDVSPAAQHAKASSNKEGKSMNEMQSGKTGQTYKETEKSPDGKKE